jgi:hypothetical protein
MNAYLVICSRLGTTDKNKAQKKNHLLTLMLQDTKFLLKDGLQICPAETRTVLLNCYLQKSSLGLTPYKGGFGRLRLRGSRFQTSPGKKV